MKNNSLYRDVIKVIGVIFILGIIEFILFTLFMSFRKDVLLGVLFGTVFASLNFLYLAYCVKKAVEKEEKAAKAYMSSTYTVRMVLVAAMIYVAANAESINLWAAIIPLAFQRIAATIVPLGRSNKA